jgi:hypothetical protein
MDIKQLPIKEVKHVHSGQYHAYGDSWSVWDIVLEEGTKVSEADMLEYCFAELSKHKVQSKKEWSENHGDAGSYFAGYYELIPTSTGYTYKKCSPYTD